MRKKYYLCIFDDMKIVRKILLVINLILIVGLLLTTIGGHVAPSVTVLPGLLAVKTVCCDSRSSIRCGDGITNLIVLISLCCRDGTDDRCFPIVFIDCH